MTNWKLREIDLELIMHSSYSLEYKLSDLFPSLLDTFAGEKDESKEAWEDQLSKFLANRNRDLYDIGIINLHSYWHEENRCLFLSKSNNSNCAK